MSGRSRGLLTLAFVAVACNTATFLDAGAPDGADATTDVGSPFFWPDASSDVVTPDALPPPAVDCTSDDGGLQCAFPPSICVDGRWLEYFDDGVCVDGGCQFQTKLIECGLACVDGGCLNHASTLVSAH